MLLKGAPDGDLSQPRFFPHPFKTPAPTYDDLALKQFPHYCPFLRGIHRSTVNSSKCGDSGAELWCWCLLRRSCWTDSWVAGDLKRIDTQMAPMLWQSIYEITKINVSVISRIVFFSIIVSIYVYVCVLDFSVVISTVCVKRGIETDEEVYDVFL